VVGRIRFALERFGSPRHRSHVAQLFSLGCYAFMKTWIKIAPVVSFIFCLLGGLILLLNGIDREDFVWCGLGLFFIGIAFFVGPMLGLVIEILSSKIDKK
jgi:hypothetical protein